MALNPFGAIFCPLLSPRNPFRTGINPFRTGYCSLRMGFGAGAGPQNAFRTGINPFRMGFGGPDTGAARPGAPLGLGRGRAYVANTNK